MATIQEIRAQYPQYNDMGDADLAKALHGKYYSDMPFEDFAAKIGLAGQAPIDANPQPSEKSIGGFVQNIGSDAYNTGAAIAGGIYAGGRKLVTDPVGAGGDVLNAIETGGKVAAGGVMNLADMATGTPNSLAMSPRDRQAQEIASGVGANLKDRYWDNLGDTLYEHPVQSALDVATLAYGGQGLAAGALGQGSKVARTLGTAAELTNPLNVIAKPIQAVRGIQTERKAMKEMRARAPSYEQNVATTNAAYTDLRSRGIAVPADEFSAVNAQNSTIGQLNSFDAPRSQALASDMARAQTGNEAELAKAVKTAQDNQATAEANLRAARGTGRPDTWEFENAAQLAAHAARQAMAKAQAGKAVFFDQLDDFRKRAGGIANDRGLGVSQTDRAAAAQIGEHIDEILNSTAGAPEIKLAREMARRNILAREAMEIDRKSKWYTSGDESGTRNQFASFGKRHGKSLTPLEEKAAKKVVRREGVHGLLNTAGSKLTQTMLLGSLGFGVGIPAALAGGALSLGGRAASAAMTNAKAKQFLQTVLAGREAQSKALLGAKRLPIKTKGLLLGGQGVGLLSGRQSP